ncbi:hypothetical protein [Haladaptatus cibarius]|uniref:hypothetical protein n=1 Tax=Haladaptatus cibarius TaxID=453847 RepID=UPI000678B6D0|nr:hypothetical protein [Haladaptatus cibarius]
MGKLEPVSWETIEAVSGAPATDVLEYINQLQDSVSDDEPYEAVKTIHDAISADLGSDCSVPDQGEVFITVYLLEQRGIIASNDDESTEFPSLVARRPDSNRLHELFWEQNRTMWWIAVQCGVHWALIRYWLYEDDIPLQERNFTDTTLEQIRAYQDQKND